MRRVLIDDTLVCLCLRHNGMSQFKNEICQDKYLSDSRSEYVVKISQ